MSKKYYYLRVITAMAISVLFWIIFGSMSYYSHSFNSPADVAFLPGMMSSPVPVAMMFFCTGLVVIALSECLWEIIMIRKPTKQQLLMLSTALFFMMATTGIAVLSIAIINPHHIYPQSVVYSRQLVAAFFAEWGALGSTVTMMITGVLWLVGYSPQRASVSML